MCGYEFRDVNCQNLFIPQVCLILGVTRLGRNVPAIAA